MLSRSWLSTVLVLGVVLTGVSSLSVHRISRSLAQRANTNPAAQPFRAEGSSKTEFVLDWEQAACRLNLPLTDNSNALFSGRVSAPETDQLEQQRPEKSVRLKGNLELSYPETCPEDYEQFLVSLREAKFSGDLDSGNVVFGEIVANSQVMDLELSFRSIQLVFKTSVPLRLHNGQFGAAFEVQLIGGKVEIKNATTIVSMRLKGATFGAASGQIEQEDGGVLVAIPNLAFSFSVNPAANESINLRLELGFVANIFARVEFPTDKSNEFMSPQLEPMSEIKSEPMSEAESEPISEVESEPEGIPVPPSKSPTEVNQTTPAKVNTTARDRRASTPRNDSAQVKDNTVEGKPSASAEARDTAKESSTSSEPVKSTVVSSPDVANNINETSAEDSVEVMMTPEVMILAQNMSVEDRIRVYVLEVEMKKRDLSLAAGFLLTPILVLFLLLVFLICYMSSQWSKYYAYFTQDINQVEDSEACSEIFDNNNEASSEEEVDDLAADVLEEMEGAFSREAVRKLAYEDIFYARRISPTSERIQRWKESHGLSPIEKKTGWETIDELASFEQDGVAYKTVLHVANGSLPSGELTAILGPPDSGKGVFVRLLAGDVSQISKKDILKGIVSLDDRMRSRQKREEFKSGLITQDVSYEEILTVSEVLGIWVGMKGPWGHNVSNQKIRSSLNEAVQQLGIWEKNQSKVSSLSLLEKRKLMIACEVAKLPLALFLEDPLEGLDAHDTLDLMSRLRALTEDNKIVVLTMNQASPDQFDLIDHLLIMSHGHLLYDGPKSQINGFLCQVGFPCSERIPIPNHILSAISDPSVLHRLICLVKNAYDRKDPDALMSIFSTKDFVNTCALESNTLSIGGSPSSSPTSESKNPEDPEISTKRPAERDLEITSFKALKGFWRSYSDSSQKRASFYKEVYTPKDLSSRASNSSRDRMKKRRSAPWKQIVLRNVHDPENDDSNPPFVEETWYFSENSRRKSDSPQSRAPATNPMVTYAGVQERPDPENSLIDSLRSDKRTSRDEAEIFFATTETDLSRKISSETQESKEQETTRPRSLSFQRTIPAEDFEQLEESTTERKEKLSVILSTPTYLSEKTEVKQETEVASHRVELTQSGVEVSQFKNTARDGEVFKDASSSSPRPFTFRSEKTFFTARSTAPQTQRSRAVSDPGTSDYSQPETRSSPVDIEQEQEKQKSVKVLFFGASDKMLSGVKSALSSLGLIRSTRSLKPPSCRTPVSHKENPDQPSIAEESEESRTLKKTGSWKTVVCQELNYDNRLKKHVPEPDWSSELAVLLLNNTTAIFRKRTGLLLHFALAILCGLLMSVFYLDLEETISGLQKRTSAVFFALSILTVASILPIIQLKRRREVILQDLKMETYRPFNFLIAQFLPDLMFLKFVSVCLFSLSFLFISNFSLGFNRVIIFIFGLTIFWATLHYTFFFILLLVPNRGGVYIMVGAVALYGLLFCGYLIPKEDLYGIVEAFTSISPMCNAFEMIVISQLSAYTITTTVATSELEEFEDSLGHASHESMGLHETRVFSDALVLLILLFMMVLLLYGVFKWCLFQRHPGTTRRHEAWRKQSFLRNAMKSSRSLLLGIDAN